MKWLSDYTGRFARYPFYENGELDEEAESLVTEFLLKKHATVKFPICTDDVMMLIEEAAEDLDWNADLSGYGWDVEGITHFRLNGDPRVEISARLTGSSMRNRFRMTLAHELAHVRLHSCLYQLPDEQALFSDQFASKPLQCKRQAIAGTAQRDWMEWQAGYAGAAILMPARIVRKLVTPLIPDGLLAAHPESTYAANICSTVADAFGVSLTAARVRLEKLRLFEHNVQLGALAQRG